MKILAWVLLICLCNARDFIHPGLGLSKADLDFVKENLNQSPWKEGHQDLLAQEFASLDYTMRGPFETVARGGIEASAWRIDMKSVRSLGLQWYFTKNENYARKAYEVLMAWVDEHKTFAPGETYLNMGYEAKYVFEGADILRSTWSGWTERDTEKCKAYFENVWWDEYHIGVPGPLRSANQGMSQLAAAVGVATFNDDEEKFNQCLEIFRHSVAAGLRSSLPNGQIGDTGRDGHDSGQLKLMAWVAEVFWNQGVDVYSEYDNRLLAAGEYISSINLLQNPQFVQAGTIYDIYPQIHNLKRPIQVIPDMSIYSLLKTAYDVRKGLPTPHIDKMLEQFEQKHDTFCYLNGGDRSRATALPEIKFPEVKKATVLKSRNMGETQGGSSKYLDGVWTLTSKGKDSITTNSADFRFSYLRLSSDASVVAKLTSLDSPNATAQAGLMFFKSIRNPYDKLQTTFFEQSGDGLQLYSRKRGEVANSHRGGELRSYGSIKNGMTKMTLPYWIKVERIGDRIHSFTSPDGVSWSACETTVFDMGAKCYFGMFVASADASGSATATFEDVRITGGDGAAPVNTPKAPLAVHTSYGDNSNILRWVESLDASRYNVWRSQNPNGPFESIGEVTGTSFVDNTAQGENNYYSVSAINSQGESQRSESASGEDDAFIYFPYSTLTDFTKAVDHDESEGLRSENCKDVGGGQNVCYISDGDWARYNNVNIQSGAVFQARVACASRESGYIEVRLNSLDGPIVSQINVNFTYGWQNWRTLYAPINSNVTGEHDLYLIFKGNRETQKTDFNLNWFNIVYPESLSVQTVEAEDYQTSDTPLRSVTLNREENREKLGYILRNREVTYTQPLTAGHYEIAINHSGVRDTSVEVYLNGKYVTVVDLPATEDWSEFTRSFASFTNASETDSLTLRFLSSYGDYLCDIDSFTLNKVGEYGGTRSLEAEAQSELINGALIQGNSSASGNSQLSHIKSGRGASYQVNLEAGTYQMALKFASVRECDAHIYLDGELVQTCELHNTGSWSKWSSKTCTFDNENGSKKLTVILVSDSTGWLCNIDKYDLSLISAE